jgi:predicted regulator of Ras-like GTPase activity (Roadblock/LC7/MglB family)/predicted Zn-dependent protease
MGTAMNIDIAEIDERINKCQRILDTDPSSQIFAALADSYRKKGNIKKALEICQKGLAKHADYASAYIVLAKIFLDQGNFQEADRQLQKAIAVAGRTRAVDILQSEIFIKLGQRDKAKIILDKLHKSDPLNETVKNLLASVGKKAKQPLTPDVPSLSLHPGEKRSYTLSNALSILKVLPRVLGVVAVTRDGMVIEGHFNGMLLKEELGALASGSFDSIAQGIAKINLGQPLEIMIEAKESKLWIINQGKLLIILSTRDDINLGSLKLKVNEIFKRTDFS